MLSEDTMNEDIFRGVGVEVDLKSQDDFLKVRETLTRIGIASKKEKNYTNLAIYYINVEDM